MMDNQEAIRWFEAKLAVNATYGIDGLQNDTARLAIKALQEQTEQENRRAAPENKPLTLEQLRQMGGEPVYSPQCGWGIIGFRKVGTGEQRHSKKYTVGFNYGWEWLDDVLRIGPLYAHKPEGSESVGKENP